MFVAFVNLHPNEYGVNKSCIDLNKRCQKKHAPKNSNLAPPPSSAAIQSWKEEAETTSFRCFLKRKEIVELKRIQVLVFGGQKDPVLARSYSFVLKRSQLTTSSGSGSNVSPERLLFLSFVEQILLEKVLPFVLE